MRMSTGNAVWLRNHQHLPRGLGLGTYVKFTFNVINATKWTRGTGAMEPALSLENLGDLSSRLSSALTSRYVTSPVKQGLRRPHRAPQLSLS